MLSSSALVNPGDKEAICSLKQFLEERKLCSEEFNQRSKALTVIGCKCAAVIQQTFRTLSLSMS